LAHASIQHAASSGMIVAARYSALTDRSLLWQWHLHAGVAQWQSRSFPSSCIPQISGRIAVKSAQIAISEINGLHFRCKKIPASKWAASAWLKRWHSLFPS